MLTSVTGIYRNGTIILGERPQNVPDEVQVIVTFLAPAQLDLAMHGIDEAQAEELRARLSTFAEDWDSAEMDVYNDYATAKTALQTR